MRKIKKLWDKSQQIKNDIDKIDIEDIKISENKKLKRVYRLDNPWKPCSPTSTNVLGNCYIDGREVKSKELNEVQFKNQYEMTTIPAVIEYTKEFELPITEQMLPWVHVVPIVNMMSSDEGLLDKMVFDIPNWEDYWEIYIDGDLLWKGNLQSIFAYNDGQNWDGFLGWDLGVFFNFDRYLAWRAKYTSIWYGSRCVYWDKEYNLPIEYRQTINDMKIKEIILPIRTYWTQGWPYPPDPPDYPIPPGNTIRIKRNLPEPEFFITKGLYYSTFNKSFAETETIKDKKGKEKAIKYKLLLTGNVQYNAPIDKEKVSSIVFPTMDRTYAVEFWEHKTVLPNLTTIWERGYRYNLVSSSEGTTIKKLYKPLITTIKMKFLVDVVNISDKNDKELYVLRTE